MAVGLEVYNDAGALVIDSNSPNYSLLASGTASSGTAVSFTSTTVRPLVFVRFNTPNRFVRISALSNNSVTFQTYDLQEGTGNFANPVAGSTEYKVFGIASTLTPSSPGFGLNVFDAAGNLIFDSNREVPRVRQVVTVPALPSVSDGNRATISAVSHSMGTNPWMLANSTFNTYGYVFLNDSPGTLSQLLWTAIRSDTNAGNRIMLEAVNGITIGSTGSSWPNAPTQIALMP
jgi:hypothetical protein